MRPSGRRPVAGRPPRSAASTLCPEATEGSGHTPRGPKCTEVTLGSGETVALATFDDRRGGRLAEALYVMVILVAPALPIGFLVGLMAYAPAADPGTFDTALALYLTAVVAALLAVAVYEARSTSKDQPRWRDARAGTRVVRLRDGQPPGYIASFGRAILPVIAGIVGFMLGASIPSAASLGLVAGLALWALVYATSFWDDHGRGWHDKLAGTVVIKGASPRKGWWTKRAAEGSSNAAG